MICSPLYELVGFGDGVGCWVRVIMVCCSCLIVISWGAFVWYVFWFGVWLCLDLVRGECGSGMIRCVRSRRFTVFVLIGLWGLLLGDLVGLGVWFLSRGLWLGGWFLLVIRGGGSGSCEVSVFWFSEWWWIMIMNYDSWFLSCVCCDSWGWLGLVVICLWLWLGIEYGGDFDSWFRVATRTLLC